MLMYDTALGIAAEHFGGAFAPHGWADDGVCVVTPQRIVDDETRGPVLAGGVWITVERATGARSSRGRISTTSAG